MCRQFLIDVGCEIHRLIDLATQFQSFAIFVVKDDGELLIGLQESQAGFELTLRNL